MIRVGTAGWSLPTDWQDRFPEGETHLHAHARVLDVAEINRTFRKTPRATTFDRWAGSVPGDFRFSVKLPGRITHDLRLEGADEAPGEEAPGLDAWLDRIRDAGEADEVWCIFDNTAAGEGTGDALAIKERLEASSES